MTFVLLKQQARRTTLARRSTKRRLFVRRFLPLAAVVISLTGSTLVLTHHATSVADSKAAKAQHDKQQATIKLRQQRAQDLATQTEAASAPVQTPTTNPATTPSPAPVAPKTATTDTRTKYSTSSDPASTAFSYTPPAANPASFDITLTHNNQVAPGTAVSYNATKGERAIYAGDLVMSVPSVTLSRASGGVYRNLGITIPDGQTAGVPSNAFGSSTAVIVATEGSVQQPDGAHFNMIVQIGYATPNGTYTLHIHTSRSAQTADAYYYDYFLPVTVTD